MPPGRNHLQERNKSEKRKKTLYLGCSASCHFQVATFQAADPEEKIQPCKPSSDCYLSTFSTTFYCPLYVLRVHIIIALAFNGDADTLAVKSSEVSCSVAAVI